MKKTAEQINSFQARRIFVVFYACKNTLSFSYKKMEKVKEFLGGKGDGEWDKIN